MCEASSGFCAVFYTLKCLWQWNSLLPVSSRLRYREEEAFIYSASREREPGGGVSLGLYRMQTAGGLNLTPKPLEKPPQIRHSKITMHLRWKSREGMRG